MYTFDQNQWFLNIHQIKNLGKHLNYLITNKWAATKENPENFLIHRSLLQRLKLHLYPSRELNQKEILKQSRSLTYQRASALISSKEPMLNIILKFQPNNPKNIGFTTPTLRKSFVSLNCILLINVVC